jgi:uncharacterized membrane protein YdjX (TVP38/TMEM64 family)
MAGTDSESDSVTSTAVVSPGRFSFQKLIVLLLIAAAFSGLWWQFGHELSLSALAEREAAFREFQRTNPVLTYGVAFAIYVVATGLSLPGATVLSIAYGRLGERLARFTQELEREGAFYLFTMRLIPAFPFFVINAVMGLTPIRLTTFWWVSQCGMFPGTILIVWTGSRFPDVETLAKDGATGVLTWDIALAFVLLGVFPLVVRKVMTTFKTQHAGRRQL